MSEDQWFQEYTDRMMVQHLLLLEDHLLDYAREPSDQCQACMFWHIGKIRAYASLECVKFSEGEHKDVCIAVSPFMDELEGAMENGFSRERSLELAKDVRDWRYKIAGFQGEDSQVEEVAMGSNPKHVTFDRADLSSAIEAARRLKSDKDLYIVPTAYGLSIERVKPPIWLRHIVVKPDGAVEEVATNPNSTYKTPEPEPMLLKVGPTIKGIIPPELAYTKVQTRLVRSKALRPEDLPVLNKPEVIQSYFQLMRDADQEWLLAIYCDTKLKPVGADEISIGTRQFGIFPVDVIVKSALLTNASTIFVVHNHPSGDPTPSPEDREALEQLKKAAGLFQIDVPDMFIVGSHADYSMALDKQIPVPSMQLEGVATSSNPGEREKLIKQLKAGELVTCSFDRNIVDAYEYADHELIKAPPEMKARGWEEWFGKRIKEYHLRVSDSEGNMIMEEIFKKPEICVDNFMRLCRVSSNPGIGEALMTGAGIGAGLVAAQKVLEKKPGSKSGSEYLCPVCDIPLEHVLPGVEPKHFRCPRCEGEWVETLLDEKAAHLHQIKPSWGGLQAGAKHPDYYIREGNPDPIYPSGCELVELARDKCHSQSPWRSTAGCDLFLTELFGQECRGQVPGHILGSKSNPGEAGDSVEHHHSLTPTWPTVCLMPHAARAIEVALAGNHSIKFVGTPWVHIFADYARDKGLEASSFLPCKCGYFKHPTKACTCTIKEIEKQEAKIKAQYADLYVEVLDPPADSLVAFFKGEFRCEAEEGMLQRVERAKALVFQDGKTIRPDAESLLKAAIKQLQLDARAVDSTRAMAISIAKLDGSTEIGPSHLAEALQYAPRNPGIVGGSSEMSGHSNPDTCTAGYYEADGSFLSKVHEIALSKCEVEHCLAGKLDSCVTKVQEGNIERGCPPEGLGTAECPLSYAVCRASISQPVCPSSN